MVSIIMNVRLKAWRQALKVYDFSLSRCKTEHIWNVRLGCCLKVFGFNHVSYDGKKKSYFITKYFQGTSLIVKILFWTLVQFFYLHIKVVWHAHFSLAYESCYMYHSPPFVIFISFRYDFPRSSCEKYPLKWSTTLILLNCAGLSWVTRLGAGANIACVLGP